MCVCVPGGGGGGEGLSWPGAARRGSSCASEGEQGEGVERSGAGRRPEDNIPNIMSLPGLGPIAPRSRHRRGPASCPGTLFIAVAIKGAACKREAEQGGRRGN